jgi:mRNA (guanine-N7-)-methyltransferase
MENSEDSLVDSLDNDNEENEDENRVSFFNNNTNSNNKANVTLPVNTPKDDEVVNINIPIKEESKYTDYTQELLNNSSSNKAPQSSTSEEMINYGLYYKNFIRDPGIEGRKASRLLFLRSFNNWIKASLINKYTFQLNRNREDLSVLDLCCGRGGDLEKYFRCKVKIYVGSDLSEESLKNALDRIVKLKNEKFKDLQTKCFFIPEDLSHPENKLLKKIQENITFDMVSCQFAMHYHCESEARIRAFLVNVVSKLNNGGYFIGTIIDANVLVKRLRNRKYQGNAYINEPFTFGNEFYSVKFYQKRFPRSASQYGIKYGFYLEDSIDKRDELGNIKYVGEYLVIFEEFVKLCLEYDLHLVERKNFTEFYEENMENSYYRNLFRKMMHDIESANKEQQWEIIHLYQIFAFRKGVKKDDYKYRYTPVLRNNSIPFKDYNAVLVTDKFD